jgi:hypothetical protein
LGCKPLNKKCCGAAQESCYGCLRPMQAKFAAVQQF